MMEVYILGGNHHNTLGVIRSLGEKGIRSNVIIQTEDSQSYVSKSCYINRCWIVNKDDEIIGLLRKEQVRLNEEKALVITCSDNLSALIDTYRDELISSYYLPCANEPGRITHLMDKEVMSQLARNVGFTVPYSVSLNTKDNYEIDFPMPWIIKPLVSKEGSKKDIERIYNIDEWVNYCKSHESKVQVQSLIDKKFEYQLIGLSLDSGNEVIIPGVSIVLRPSKTSNTGFLHYTPLDNSYRQVLKICEQFLRTTCYSGLFSLEFLRGKDGNDYFMEINFRNDGNAICVTASGVNLPYIWYLYSMGADYHNELNKCHVNSVYVMPELADIALIRQKELGLLQWFKDLLRTNRFMEYDKHDKAPFCHLLGEYFKRGVKKIGKHAWKY